MNDETMTDLISVHKPAGYDKLMSTTKDLGFSMSSDPYIGSLLRTLVSSKPNANILELGTGLGLSLLWMLEGLAATSRITSIENDPKLAHFVKEHFSDEPRVNIILADASQWINSMHDEHFDLIFADAWPGKYSDLDQTLDLLSVGGIYVVDDMATRESWPEGHQEKANGLVKFLDQRNDLLVTKMHWGSGVILATRSA